MGFLWFGVGVFLRIPFHLLQRTLETTQIPLCSEKAESESLYWLAQKGGAKGAVINFPQPLRRKNTSHLVEAGEVLRSRRKKASPGKDRCPLSTFSLEPRGSQPVPAPSLSLLSSHSLTWVIDCSALDLPFSTAVLVLGGCWWICAVSNPAWSSSSLYPLAKPSHAGFSCRNKLDGVHCNWAVLGEQNLPVKILMKQEADQKLRSWYFYFGKNVFLKTLCYGEQLQNFWITNSPTVNLSDRSLQIVKPNDLKCQFYITVVKNCSLEAVFLKLHHFYSVKGNDAFLKN